MASISAGGFTFDIDSVGGRWYWTVQASNVQGSSQLYQIVDITSPWGKFTDVDQPLPGDVVLAMADTLQQFQAQLAPLLALVSPGTTVFNLTVTEGDPSSQAAVVPFQNAGAFGSFLTATATPDSNWLAASPPSIAGLNKNDQGQFTIKISPSLMLSASSPYTGHVNLQDNRSPPTVIPLTFNVTVLPRPAIATDVSAVNFSYSLSAHALPGSQQVQVQNSGPAGSQLNVTAAKVQNLSPWLAFVPTSLGPLASSVQSPITFSIVQAGIPASPGTYIETIILQSPNATNSPVTVTVTLVVSP